MYALEWLGGLALSKAARKPVVARWSYYHSGARASSESHESLTSEDRVRISTMIRVFDGVGGCRSGGGAVGRCGLLGGVGVQDEPERALPAPALRATEQVFHLVSLLSVR